MSLVIASGCGSAMATGAIPINSDGTQHSASAPSFIYVTDPVAFPNTIEVFSDPTQGKPTLVKTLKIDRKESYDVNGQLAVDSQGNLYSLREDSRGYHPAQLAIYRRGESHASVELDLPWTNPRGLALDAKDNIYISSGGGGTVMSPSGHSVALAYIPRHPNNKTHVSIIGGFPQDEYLEGLTIDQQRNVWIAAIGTMTTNSPGSSAIFKLTPNGTPTQAPFHVSDPDSIVILPSGNAAISNESTYKNHHQEPFGDVSLFSNFNEKPGSVLREVSGKHFAPGCIAVDQRGSLWVISRVSNSEHGLLTELNAQTLEPIATFRDGFHFYETPCLTVGPGP